MSAERVNDRLITANVPSCYLSPHRPLSQKFLRIPQKYFFFLSKTQTHTISNYRPHTMDLWTEVAVQRDSKQEGTCTVISRSFHFVWLTTSTLKLWNERKRHLGFTNKSNSVFAEALLNCTVPGKKTKQQVDRNPAAIKINKRVEQGNVERML